MGGWYKTTDCERVVVMTLARWCKKYHVDAVPYGLAMGVFTVDYMRNSDAKWNLHHLSDYRVSSIVAGMTLLIPVESVAGKKRYRK